MQAHCCGADKIFDDRDALKDTKRYQRKGPRKSTARLMALMKSQVNDGDSLLDIGGGIGAIGLELCKEGLAQYTSIDASSGYQAAAQKLFDQGKTELKLKFIQNDFVEVAPEIDQHHHVSLDKVVCCYPQLEKLLRSAAQKAKIQIGLVYPPSNWLSRLLRLLANIYLKLNGTAFRTYIHPELRIHKILVEEGFYMKSRKFSLPWWVEVWQR